jgi:hypothetical protein
VAATVSIDGDVLTVVMHGLDKLWSIRSQLDIPLTHVRENAVVIDQDAHATVELVQRAITGRAGSAER